MPGYCSIGSCSNADEKYLSVRLFFVSSFVKPFDCEGKEFYEITGYSKNFVFVAAIMYDVSDVTGLCHSIHIGFYFDLYLVFH